MNEYTTADLSREVRRQDMSIYLQSRKVADPRLISAKLKSISKFDDLLPTVTDPVKSILRNKLIAVLNTKGEILPSSESTLGKLWKLVNSDRSSLDDCEEVILLDPLLTSRIFKVSNSAAYRANAKSVSDALRFIGFKVLRELAFNAGVFSQFSNLGNSSDWQVFWLRSLFVGRLCERICGSFFPTSGNEYLAGLIHDLGWLFIAAYAPDEFAQIYHSEKPIAEGEVEFLPFTHAQIGAALAARSSLPLPAVDAVAYHHRKILQSKSTAVQPRDNPLFLGIVLGVCDSLADASGLDLFDRPIPTIEEVMQSDEVRWLKAHKPLDIETMIEEERIRADEIQRNLCTDK